MGIIYGGKIVETGRSDLKIVKKRKIANFRPQNRAFFLREGVKIVYIFSSGGVGGSKCGIFFRGGGLYGENIVTMYAAYGENIVNNVHR